MTANDLLRHSSALGHLGLEYPVVAVKFSTAEPVDLPRLNKRIAFCEMLKEAQEAGAFYASKEEQGCAAGSYVLGQIGHDPMMESGRIGPEIGVYENAEANRRVPKACMGGNQMVRPCISDGSGRTGMRAVRGGRGRRSTSKNASRRVM